jgi:hypothetical protein
MGRRSREFVGHGVVAMLFVLCGVEASAKAQTLTANERILGFEAPTVTDWAVINSGAGTLSVSTTASQGSRALAVKAHGFAPVQSAALSSLGSSVANIVRYDIMLPSDLPSLSPYWYGATQLLVDIPSKNIHSQFIGQVELTGLPVGVWRAITFTPPADLMNTLRGVYSDLRFTIVVNSPYNAVRPYLIDNVRFSDTTVAPPTFYPVAGMYPVTQNLVMACAASGASIYYTTDGSTPTSSSTKYTGSIAVASTETFKAICSVGGAASAAASSTYTIGVDLRPEITNRGIPIRLQLSTDYCVLFAMTFLQEYLLAGALGTAFNHLSVDYAIQAGNVAGSATGGSSSFNLFSMGYNTYGAVLDSVWPFTGATYNFATWNTTFTPLISTGTPLLNTGSRLAGKCLREGDDGPTTMAQLEEVMGYLIRGIPVAIAFGGHAVGLVGFEKKASDAGGGHFIFKDSYPAGYQEWTFDFLMTRTGVALYAYEWGPAFPLLYEGTNYAGYNYTLADGSYLLRQLTDMGASDNSIRSLRVPAGYTVRLYQDDNFGEPHVDITGDVSDLSTLGFDARASSIRIIH